MTYKGPLWAALEGANRAVLGAVAKALGEVARTVNGCAQMTVIYGSLQIAYGLWGLKRCGHTVNAAPWKLALYSLFAIGAVFNTTVGIWVYTLPGADMGVSTFLRTTSIVIAAFIAWGFLNQTPTWNTWVGIVLFLLGGWLMVGAPSLSALQSLPAWVWWSLSIAVFAALNETFTSCLNRGIPKGDSNASDASHFNFQFWTGTLTATFGLPVVIASGGFILRDTWMLLFMIIIAIGVVIQLAWRFFAYSDDTFVVLKKFFTTSVYLILAMVFGILFHAESMDPLKVSGIPFAFLAYLFMDPKAVAWALSPRRATAR